MTELEKKLLLSKDEYDYLMEHFRHNAVMVSMPFTKQINYYYDTDDFSMNRQNTTCRIRLKDGKYKAIMKKHSTSEDQSTETEMEIYDGLESNAFTEMGLKLQGELITERCIIWKDAHYEVVLDKNEYLGHTDYELEIEYSPGHEKDSQAILQMFRNILVQRKCFLIYQENLKKSPNAPSKSNRFFEKKGLCQASQKEEGTPVASNVKETFNYSDPDDYMRDYRGSIVFHQHSCSSCAYYNGASCQSRYGACEYKHC